MGSMYWHPATIARLLKESCYWGEAIAYRYESFERVRRDPTTHRLRKRKATRYRNPDSDVIVRYPPEVWPGIVSKELAMKAIARLKENQTASERTLKNTGLSFLRAGLAKCGYCGANMILHSSQDRKDAPIHVRFVCGQHRANLVRRPGAKPCSAVTQYSLRVNVVEEAVWSYLVDVLRDPDHLPDTYQQLESRETEVRSHQGERIDRLTKLIDVSTGRRNEYMRAVGMTNDADMKLGYMRLADEENANIRTWQAEREHHQAELNRQLSETKEIRSTVRRINSRAVEMLRMTTAKRRRLAETLGVRVICFRDRHDPYFVLVSDVPGLTTAWRAKRHQRLPVEPIRYTDAESAALFASWQGEDPAHLVYRDAIVKWTAPVKTIEKVKKVAGSAQAVAGGTNKAQI